MINIKTKLFFVALSGSLITWLLIKTFLLEMTIAQFLIIELLVGFSHYVYNDVKLKLQQ